MRGEYPPGEPLTPSWGSSATPGETRRCPATPEAGSWFQRGGVTRLWHRRAIVLTTTGRRSRRPRTVLVQVFQDGADLLVVAANSGLPRPPGWYFNLLAEPRVVGEVDGHRIQLRAELLPEAEASTAWHTIVLETAPDYEKYARRLGRVPPIFRLRYDPSET